MNGDAMKMLCVRSVAAAREHFDVVPARGEHLRRLRDVGGDTSVNVVRRSFIADKRDAHYADCRSSRPGNLLPITNVS